jgi:NADH-quinone oxidoreductase subunit K
LDLTGFLSLFKLKKNTMALGLLKYLNIAITLYLLGIWGIVLNRKNIIILLMSIELMLLSINLNFVTFSVFLDDLVGQVFALFVLTVAAAESAIGLAILVAYYRVRNTIAVEDVSMLRS